MMKYLLLFGNLMAGTLFAAAQNRYTIEYKDSLSSKIQISIQLEKPVKATTAFIIPRFAPGTYSMLVYDKFVEGLQAISSSGNKIAMRKDPNDAPRWTCVDTNQTITGVVYTVNVDRMERRLSPGDASAIRSGFAGLLNYSILGWIEGTETQPVQCTINSFQHWPIFSTNQPLAEPVKGSFTFSTSTYHALADGQVFLGPKFQVKQFKGLVPLFIAAYCETADEYLDDYGKQGMLCMEMLQSYFGELPFKEYSILLRKVLPLEPGNYPGLAMEHLQSSTFFGDTSEFRSKPMSQEQLMTTIPTYLHHMGHAFIPLRCYGDNYRPYVQEIPPVMNIVWFNEGFMWFVAYIILKSEAWQQRFYNNTYKAAPQIRRMSLEELSQTASFMYGEDFRLGRAVYSRGASMAIEMNNYLKEKTGGQKSMQDVLRFLYQWSQQNKRPFTKEELPTLFNQACGIDLSAIYNKWQLPIE